MKLIHPKRVCRPWLGLLGLLAASLGPLPVRADAVVTNATFAALAQAMAGGGSVRLNVKGTITLEDTIDVVLDTTLDAEGQELTLSGANSRRLFNVAHGVQFGLNHLTLTGGSNAVGAAIYNQGGTILATNCVFSKNNAVGSSGADGDPGGDSNGAGEDGYNGEDGTEGQGGAIYNQGTLRLYQCTFQGNQASGGNGGAGGAGGDGSWRGGNGGHGGAGASGFGGAIYSTAGLWLSDCAFTANTTKGGAGGKGGTNGTGDTLRYPGGGGAGGDAAGGAIFNTGSLWLYNSTLATNKATAGAATNRGGFINNGASAERGPSGGTAFGGALENLGTAYVLQCTFYTNAVQGGSGGAGGKGILGGAVGGNGGHGYGGSLDSAGLLLITNCTMAGSYAGGGTPGTNTLTNLLYSTTGDPGEGRGGNLAVRAGSCRLLNTIVASAVSGNNSYGSLIDAGHNISSDKSCRWTSITSQSATDPRLGPLSDQGGVTATMALLSGSPAIDRAAAVSGLTTDQRGQPRPSGKGYDIGAYEVVLYALEGRVTIGTMGMAGLTLTLTSSNLTRTTVTDSLGQYAFSSLAPQTYQVTPPAAGVGFSPTQRTVPLNVLGTNAVQQDFAANPSRITALNVTPDQRLISGLGIPKIRYQAQTSSDLVHWDTLATNAASSAGVLEFIDRQIPPAEQRFYRLKSPLP